MSVDTNLPVTPGAGGDPAIVARRICCPRGLRWRAASGHPSQALDTACTRYLADISDHV